MSSSELWQRILAAPADADLKAQYAAALAAAGDPRAEMFSAAAEYTHLVYTMDDEGAKALLGRLGPLQARFSAEFASLAVPWNGQVKLIMGWPCDLTIAAADFVRHAAEIVATLPIRHLTLTAISESPALFELAQLDQIASLDGSHQRWSDDAVGALANSGHLRSLRWLNLSKCRITEAQIDILAAAPALRAVEMLDLSDNRARDLAGEMWSDWSGPIPPQSSALSRFGSQLESRHGYILWLHSAERYWNLPLARPSRYDF
jgi:hypothetical protein